MCVRACVYLREDEMLLSVSMVPRPPPHRLPPSSSSSPPDVQSLGRHGGRGSGGRGGGGWKGERDESLRAGEEEGEVGSSASLCHPVCCLNPGRDAAPLHSSSTTMSPCFSSPPSSTAVTQEDRARSSVASPEELCLRKKARQPPHTHLTQSDPLLPRTHTRTHA